MSSRAFDEGTFDSGLFEDLNFQTSLIQVYTDALVAALRARSGLRNTVITDGVPPPSVMQSTEWLALLDVNGEQSWSAIDQARRPRDEVFTIDGLISVISATTAGDTEVQPALNRRAFEILAEVELCVRADPQMGVGPQRGADPAGYVIVSQVGRPIRLQKRASDTSREAAIEFGVEVTARL